MAFVWDLAAHGKGSMPSRVDAELPRTESFAPHTTLQEVLEWGASSFFGINATQWTADISLGHVQSDDMFLSLGLVFAKHGAFLFQSATNLWDRQGNPRTVSSLLQEHKSKGSVTLAMLLKHGDASTESV